MILNFQHPYTKFFTVWLDGEKFTQFFQYDTTRKVAALGKDDTDLLFAWAVSRSYKAGMSIGEYYEIQADHFVRDVEADFTLLFSDDCPPRVREELLK